MSNPNEITDDDMVYLIVAFGHDLAEKVRHLLNHVAEGDPCSYKGDEVPEPVDHGLHDENNSPDPKEGAVDER